MAKCYHTFVPGGGICGSRAFCRAVGDIAGHAVDAVNSARPGATPEPWSGLCDAALGTVNAAGGDEDITALGDCEAEDLAHAAGSPLVSGKRRYEVVMKHIRLPVVAHTWICAGGFVTDVHETDDGTIAVNCKRVFGFPARETGGDSDPFFERHF